MKSLIESTNKSLRQQRLEWEAKHFNSPNEIYLVQRICSKLFSERAKGVDRYFSFDYMGSAEFEYGALPNALREMRAYHANGRDGSGAGASGALLTKEIKLGDNSFGWFVGPEERFDMAVMLVEDQHKDRPALRYKENPRMKDKEYIGWFVLDASFVIFRDSKDADLWLGEMILR